ncbi:hypothetical protein BsWGS_25765 [Bradybaena similaris]
MPSKYSTHVKGINPNFETIERCPFLGADPGASSSQDLLVKRRKSKIHGNSFTDPTSEKSKSNNSTVQDGHPEQCLLPTGAGTKAAVESQTSLSVTGKPARKMRKKAAKTSKPIKQHEECVEVYIAKFTSAETSVVTPVSDGHLAAVHGSNKADDEATTENEKAVVIKDSLERKFNKVKNSESHQNKGHEDNRQDHRASEDCLIVCESAQEGSERQVQIHQEDDASKESKYRPATPQPLHGKAVIPSYGGLELKVVAGQEERIPDEIQQSEKKVKDPGYPECASQIGSGEPPKGLTDAELMESEQSGEKLIAADSPLCMVPSTSHDLFSEELSLADSEQAENGLKPVEVRYVVDTNFPMGSLDVGLECEVSAADTEPSFSLLTPSMSGFKRSKVIPTKRMLSSRGRRIKTPHRLETTSDDETMSPTGPRQMKAKAKAHYRSKLVVEGSSTRQEDEAIVVARTATTPRKRKVIVEETLSSEPVFKEESPTAVTNQLADDERDRPVSVETSDSAVAKTSHAVVNRTSKHRRRGRHMKVSTEAPVSEIKTMSVVVETFEPVSTSESETVLTHNSVSKPVSSKVMNVTKPVSSRRFVSKQASLEKCKLFEKHHSGALLNSTSHQANSSHPPLVELSRSKSRSYAAAKRKSQTLNNESSDAYQTDSMESILARKPEPAQKPKYKVSSVADNAFSKVSSETVGIFERMVQNPFDSVCLSVDTASSAQDDMEVGEDTVVGARQKPNEAVVMPPADYISFNDTGDVEISEIIMNAIPQFVENGSTQIYLLMRNVTLPSSDKQENLVFAADLSSSPYKFNQLTSFPNKRFAQGMLASRAPEAQAVKELSASVRAFTQQQTETRKDSPPCSSSFDDSSGIEAQDPHLSMNGDITTGTEQPIVLAIGDKIINSPMANWTHVDTSAWLMKHGLKKTFALSFSCMDGPRMLELVHYFNEDLDNLIKYLQEMGFLLIDQLKLFQALGTISTQTCTSTSFLSAEPSPAGTADLFGQVSEVKDMAAPASRKRGRKPKSNRGHSVNVSGGTEAGPLTISVPSIKWTYEDVSTWLTSLGLARFTVDFAEFDGQGVSVLVNLFKTNVRAVHKMLHNMDFTLFESLTFCARLRTLSHR